jgi:aryl-alcohol dehydrogenase-like predicted oxidoreductase
MEIEINMEFVDKLKPIAERRGVTLTQLALAWSIHREEVTSAIVGCRNPEQIESTVTAAEIELDQNDIDDIHCLIEERENSE